MEVTPRPKKDYDIDQYSLTPISIKYQHCTLYLIYPIILIYVALILTTFYFISMIPYVCQAPDPLSLKVHYDKTQIMLVVTSVNLGGTGYFLHLLPQYLDLLDLLPLKTDHLISIKIWNLTYTQLTLMAEFAKLQSNKFS